MEKRETQIEELWRKYCRNSCTAKEFDQWCDLLNDEGNAEQLNRLLKEKWALSRPNAPKNRLYPLWVAGAAAAVLLLALTLPFMVRQQTSTEPSGETVAQTAPFSSSVTNIVLSDGSTIALREGSKLSQGANFDGDAREVSLEGEAYFDIVSNPDKPFIIYTGQIKTTVLGTSFSIKAYTGDPQVVVTVTKGKVQVENERTLLAILEADNQLVYHTGTKKSTEKAVDAQKEVDWKSHELLFRNKSFAFITEEIGRAYDVTIVFESEALKNQYITASIDIRDPIERVLEMVCLSQRAGFTLDNGVYKIKQLQQQTNYK